MEEILDVTLQFPADQDEEVGEAIEARFHTLRILGYHTEQRDDGDEVATLHLYYESDTVFSRNETPLIELVNELGFAYKPTQNVLVEENYLTAYREFLRPRVIEDMLVIVPGASEWETITAGKTLPKVYIDAQYAFGTGTHPTTHLVLSLFLRSLRDGTIPRGGKASTPVIDVGCGSGILSVAAMKMGYENVTALDIDSDAVRCTLENARINDVPPPRTYVGEVTAFEGEKFALVFMNIQTEIILPLLPTVFSILAPSGLLFLSGILTERTDEVDSALAECGFSTLRKEKEDEWTAYMLSRS